MYVAAAQYDNDNDRFRSPKFTVNPPLSGAAIAGRLECVQVLVDEVGVWIEPFIDIIDLLIAPATVQTVFTARL